MWGKNQRSYEGGAHGHFRSGMSSHYMKRDNEQEDDGTIYTIGTSILGTKTKQEDSITGYTPVIRDHRGRTRFHGAFTGGFSAGYFNTVGTKEGYKAKYDSWTSSRDQRSKKIRQTPLDFMDDEDMATSKNFMTVQQSFDSLNHSKSRYNNNNNDNNNDNDYNNRKRQRPYDNDNDDMFARLFDSNKNENEFENRKNNNKDNDNDKDDELSRYLFENNNNNNGSNNGNDNNEILHNTMGFKLLKKCGWRVGHRIGSKKSMNRLKYLIQNEKDSNSLSMMQLIDESNEINSSNNKNENNKEMEAIPLYRPNHKNNLFGFGYNPSKHDDLYLDKQSFDSNKQELTNDNNNNSKNGTIHGQLPDIDRKRHGLSTLEDIDDIDDNYTSNAIEFGQSSKKDRFNTNEYDTSILAIEYDDNENGKRNEKDGSPHASLDERRLIKMSHDGNNGNNNKDKNKDEIDVEFEQFVKEMFVDSKEDAAAILAIDSNNENDNNNNNKKRKNVTMDGELPIDGFVISTRLDQDYLMKEEIWKENQKSQKLFESQKGSRKSRFRDKESVASNSEFHDNSLDEIFNIVVPRDFDENKKFETNKMEIRSDLIDVFKNLDLRVGSFLIRQNSHNDDDYYNDSDKNKNKNTSKMKYNLSQRRQMYDQTGLPKMKMNSNDDNDDNAINEKKKQLSKHLSDKFAIDSSNDSHHTVTMLNDNDLMGGLKAGITFAHELASNKEINMQQNGMMVLKRLRSMFSDNIPKLSRFDKFIAKQLKIDEMKMKNELSKDENDKTFDNDDNLNDINDNLTDFQQMHEENDFETKWNDQLLKYEKHLFPNIPRMINTEKSSNDGNANDKNKVWTKEEAAEANLYGIEYNTRKVEMWIPEPLLCKRMNVKNPFEGMMIGKNNNDNQTSFEKEAEMLFSSVLNKQNSTSNEKENENENDDIIPQFISTGRQQIDKHEPIRIKSRMEEVADILDNENNNKRQNASDNIPPILSLKQVAPWKSYLMNKDTHDDADGNNVKNNDIMSKILDITSDSDDEDDIDETSNNNDSDSRQEKNEKNQKQGKEEKQPTKELNLFKSIFENGNESDSDDSDDSDDDGSDDNESSDNKAMNQTTNNENESTAIVDLTEEKEESKQKMQDSEKNNPETSLKRSFVAQMIDLTDAAPPIALASNDNNDEPPKKKMRFVPRQNRHENTTKIETMTVQSISNDQEMNVNNEEQDEYEWVIQSSNDELDEMDKHQPKMSFENSNSNDDNDIEIKQAKRDKSKKKKHKHKHGKEKKKHKDRDTESSRKKHKKKKHKKKSNG